jgi:formylglycine-generating enzyme required for sulfatase activity
VRHETEHRSFGDPDEPVVVVDWYGASNYAKAS